MTWLRGWSLVSASVVALASSTASFAGPPIPPTHNDLAYSTHPQQKLDMYLPDEPICARWPVVIYIFGGGWQVGNEASVQRYVETLLDREVAVVSIMHRLSDQAIFPAQIHDCKGAIRWLRAHAEEYNLDPTRFAIFGDSSGGHLASLIGTSAGVASLEGTVGGNPGFPSNVQVVGDFVGPTDLPQITHENAVAHLFGFPNHAAFLANLSINPTLAALVTSADPATHATSDDPSFQLVYGEDDTIVPPAQGEHLDDALTAANVSSSLTLLRDVGHDVPIEHYEPVFDYFEFALAFQPTHDDLHYDGHFRQKLDLYIPDISPQACAQPLPVAIFIFGGGWLFGDEFWQVQRYVQPLLQRGFAIASLSYRLSGDDIFPAQIHDCKGAIRWLRAHAAEYNLDPTRFAIFGDSSGAHLASLVGTSAGVASLEGNVGGNLAFSSSVQAVGAFAGPSDLLVYMQLTNSGAAAALFGHTVNDILSNINNPNPPWPALYALIASANPAEHSTGEDPPFYIVHGQLDAVVPISQAQLLHDALTGAHVPSVLTQLAMTGHGVPLCNYFPVFDEFATLLGPPAPVPADTNCDGLVNVDDLLNVISNWGACPAPPAPCIGDVDNSGVVNVDDLLMVISGWAP